MESAKQAFPPHPPMKSKREKVGALLPSPLFQMLSCSQSLTLTSFLLGIRTSLYLAQDRQHLSTSQGPQLTTAKPITGYKASSYTRSFGLTEPHRGRDFQYLPHLKGEFNVAHFNTNLLSINFALSIYGSVELYSVCSRGAPRLVSKAQFSSVVCGSSSFQWYGNQCMQGESFILKSHFAKYQNVIDSCTDQSIDTKATKCKLDEDQSIYDHKVQKSNYLPIDY